MAAKEGAASCLEVGRVYSILFEAVGRFHTISHYVLERTSIYQDLAQCVYHFKEAERPPSDVCATVYTTASVLRAYSVFTTFLIVGLLNINEPPFELG